MCSFDMIRELDDRKRRFEQVCVGLSGAQSMEAAEWKKCPAFSLGALKRRIWLDQSISTGVLWLTGMDLHVLQQLWKGWVAVVLKTETGTHKKISCTSK